jgi:hypothetical protein
MSDDLSIQGTLEEMTVPDLFRSLIRSGDTAVVSLASPQRRDDIYFLDGRIGYASSSDPDLALGEILLRSGDINLRQYSDAMEKLVSSKRIGSVLCDLGYLKPDELIRAVEHQAQQIIHDAIGCRSGKYSIDFTSSFPTDVITLPLNTERLVLDGIRRLQNWSLIARGIGNPERLLAHVPHAESRVYSLSLDENESYLFSLFSEPITINAACERSYLSNFDTCRIVWGLFAANLLEDAERKEISARRAAAESEMQLEETVELYNSAFQRIFAFVMQKIGDHIYDFIDRVVLHLSPEVLPYLSGVNLLNEGRVDFDQFLNNLISSGSADRARIVNDVLNELLYGWIFEIRTEFGAATEKEVIGMIDDLRDNG